MARAPPALHASGNCPSEPQFFKDVPLNTEPSLQIFRSRRRARRPSSVASIWIRVCSMKAIQRGDDSRRSNVGVSGVPHVLLPQEPLRKPRPSRRERLFGLRTLHPGGVG